MGRIVLAVVGGYFLTGILVVATDRLFALFVPGMDGTGNPPAYCFALSLVTDSLYSLGAHCVRRVPGNRQSGDVLKFRSALARNRLADSISDRRVDGSRPADARQAPRDGIEQVHDLVRFFWPPQWRWRSRRARSKNAAPTVTASR